MQLDPNEVEELAKALYVRALKLLPPDIKRGFERLTRAETDATARTILGTMVENIAVAERTNNLLCQDTGIPIYNVTIGRNVEFDGVAMTAAIRRGCERATREHPLRSSVVHPITRKNEQTSCGIRIPIINVEFDERDETVAIEMIPKGSGSENGSFLQMLIPADGAAADQALRHRPRDRMRRPRLPADHRRRRHRRHVGSLHASRQDRGDAAARHDLLRARRRQDRGGAERGGERARHRAAGARRPRHLVPRACRDRGDAHHHESGRREHPVPLGAPRRRR